MQNANEIRGLTKYWTDVEALVQEYRNQNLQDPGFLNVLSTIQAMVVEGLKLDTAGMFALLKIKSNMNDLKKVIGKDGIFDVNTDQLLAFANAYLAILATFPARLAETPNNLIQLRKDDALNPVKESVTLLQSKVAAYQALLEKRLAEVEAAKKREAERLEQAQQNDAVADELLEAADPNLSYRELTLKQIEIHRNKVARLETKLQKQLPEQLAKVEQEKQALLSQQQNIKAKIAANAEFKYRLALAKDNSYFGLGTAADQEHVDTIVTDLQLTPTEQAQWQQNEKLLGWIHWMTLRGGAAIPREQLVEKFLTQRAFDLSEQNKEVSDKIVSCESNVTLLGQEITRLQPELAANKNTLKELENIVKNYELFPAEHKPQINAFQRDIVLASEGANATRSAKMQKLKSSFNNFFDTIIDSLTSLIKSSMQINNKFEQAVRTLFKIQTDGSKSSKMSSHANAITFLGNTAPKAEAQQEPLQQSLHLGG